MKAKDFVKKARAYAKKKGLDFVYDPGHGKGSHGHIYVGDKHTTIIGKDKEIKKGLLHRMLETLNIDKKDF